MSAQPRTSFEWSRYADATFAGLAVLIPIPFVDWAFEAFFRRRMPAAIARSHGRVLPPAVTAELNRSDQGCLTTCLTLPVTATLGLLQRLSRKILYFLTIKESTDKLSYYWHRAFLLDYMLAAGHLDTAASTRVARQAMEQVLGTTTNPLTQLARRVATSIHHSVRTLRTARQGRENDDIQQARTQMEQHWDEFEGYFRTVAARYEQAYQQLQAHQNTTV